MNSCDTIKKVISNLNESRKKHFIREDKSGKIIISKGIALVWKAGRDEENGAEFMEYSIKVNTRGIMPMGYKNVWKYINDGFRSIVRPEHWNHRVYVEG